MTAKNEDDKNIKIVVKAVGLMLLVSGVLRCIGQHINGISPDVVFAGAILFGSLLYAWGDLK